MSRNAPTGEGGLSSPDHSSARAAVATTPSPDTKAVIVGPPTRSDGLQMEEVKLRRDFERATPFIINDIQAIRYWEEEGDKLVRRIEAQERRVRRAEAAMNATMPPK